MECVVGCYQQIMDHPPKEGTILTVKYSGYWTSGKLKYPYFWKERHDITWEDILLQDRSDLSKKMKRDFSI